MNVVGRTVTLATLIVVTHHRLRLVASARRVGIARISRHCDVVASSADETERWLSDKVTEAAGSTKREGLMLATALSCKLERSRCGSERARADGSGCRIWRGG